MKKDKEIYLIAAWSILSLAVLFVFILPNYRNISATAKEIKTAEENLVKMQQTGQNKTEADNDYRLIKDNLPKIETAIPKKGEELKFITSLEEVAGQNNLNQKMNLLISTGDQSKTTANQTNDIATLPFQINLDGGFQNFLNYLTDLDKNYLYLNISQLKISQVQTPTVRFGNETPISDNIHVILTGESFWQ